MMKSNLLCQYSIMTKNITPQALSSCKISLIMKKGQLSMTMKISNKKEMPTKEKQMENANSSVKKESLEANIVMYAKGFTKKTIMSILRKRHTKKNYNIVQAKDILKQQYLNLIVQSKKRQWKG